MPFNIGPGELIIVLVIALVVLGPGKLPDVASSLGKSLREFRKAASDVTDATRIDAPAPAPSAPQIASAPTAGTTVAPPNTLSGAADPNTLTPTEPASDPDPS
jgi:sec-independent protein translocase protein TatA